MTTIYVAELPREGEDTLHVLRRSVPLLEKNRQALLRAYETFHTEKMAGLPGSYLDNPKLFHPKSKVGYFQPSSFQRAFRQLEIARGCGNAIAVRFAHEEERYKMREMVEFHENMALYLLGSSFCSREEANDRDETLRTHFTDSWCLGMDFQGEFLAGLTFEVSEEAQEALVKLQARVARIQANVTKIEKRRARREFLWKRSDTILNKTIREMDGIVAGARFAVEPDLKETFLSSLF